MATPAGELPAGATVGEFRVEKAVGAGGMGTVYAAVHPVIGKRAAVKVLRNDLAHQDILVQRFIDEARAVNHIRHPHIVDIFAFGALPDGRQFFVMEWLEGETLSARLARGVVDFSTAMSILEQLCDALSVTHKKGIVHRDLKPDNVFLTPTGTGQPFVKLLDFGIAKLSSSIKEPSEIGSLSGTVVGTPDYMSPEQAQALETGGPSDVYSLGVLAYELIAGRRPFVGRSVVEVMAQHLSKAAPSPKEHWPEIPAALERLLLGMLEKAPERRPAIDDVKRGFREVRAALELSMATNDADSATVDSRPMLLRSFVGISALLRPLVSELSAGAAWVEAVGEAPPAGTPITVRFEASDSGAEVDVAAVLGSALAGGSGRVMLRYDRVDRARLDRFFALASEQRAQAGEGDDKIAPGVFCEPRARRFSRAERSVGPAISMSSPTKTWAEGLVGTPRSRDLPALRAPATHGAQKVAEPAPKKAQRGLPVGLGLKLLTITVSIAALGVASVASIALEQTANDREFYLQDLTVRASTAVAGAIERQLDGWRAALALLPAAGDAAGVDAAFVALTVCDGDRCKALRGPQLSSKALGSALGTIADGELFLALGAEDLLLAVRHGSKLSLARSKPEALISAADIAPDLAVGIVGGDPRVLAARAPSGGRRRLPPAVLERLLEHELVKDFYAQAGLTSSGKSYTAPDGTALIGAFTRTRGLGVVVLADRATSSELNQDLARRVTATAAVVVLLAVILAVLSAGAVTRRLRSLNEHARSVAEGDFAAENAVQGRDEVGQLAVSLGRMTAALRERDIQVLRAQKAMSAAEARSVQRQIAEFLEHDLAKKLADLRRLAASPLGSAKPDPAQLERGQALVELSEQATASLQAALLFSSIASQRVDLASAVAESVEIARERLPQEAQTIVFTAPNAVLFPRLEARESEVREMVLLLVWRAAEALGKAGKIRLSLSQVGNDLRLLVVFANEAAAKAALGEVGQLAKRQGASARYESHDGPAVAVIFAVPAEEKA